MDIHSKIVSQAFFFVYFPYFEKCKKEAYEITLLSVCLLVSWVNRGWPSPAQSFLVLGPVKLMTLGVVQKLRVPVCMSVSYLHNFGVDCIENIPLAFGCHFLCGPYCVK
jgi:hypothetical protein